ncbi:hypothetical protein [Mycoplana ramosa]|uniref:Uncharacterized protein n=2 Tax=Mycoplana ramosa TaxID=40837 RepID=A0ABW3YST9_MYCRA
MLPTIILTVVAALCSAPANLTNAKPLPEAVMQKGPNAGEAIAAEYARLKAKGTREALELFIERHPGDPLAEKARQEIERLYGKDRAPR